MNWLYRDPLRKWLSFDKFPYERVDGELEVDFMYKAVVYLITLLIASCYFIEGGFVVYLVWILVNSIRRND